MWLSMAFVRSFLKIYNHLCTVYTNCSVELCLVGSKTGVAPIKGQTIPRLELLGAVI